MDEALARALEELDLRREQVDVDVIREGKRGVFGFGGEDAIIRVIELAPTPASPPAGRSPRPPRQRGGAPAAPAASSPRARDDEDDDDDEGPSRSAPVQESRGGMRNPQPSAAPEGRSGPPRGDGGSRGGRGDRPGGGEARGPRGERGGDRGDRGAGRPSDRGGERRDMRPRGRPDADAPPVRIPGVPDEPPFAPPADAEDEMDFAGRSLRDLLTLLGLTETEIAAREPETPGDGSGLVSQVFDIYGENEDASNELGLLIGRRGDTLSSLQYLLNVMVSTRYGNDHVFGLDIEQYRRRREQTLVDMAKRIAAEVRETGDVITLEPMPASERRIIHLTLEEEPGVHTASVGRGADRQVEVLPGDEE